MCSKVDWKSQLVFEQNTNACSCFSVNNARLRLPRGEYVCVDCSLPLTQHGSDHVTEKDVENYFIHLGGRDGASMIWTSSTNASKVYVGSYSASCDPFITKNHIKAVVNCSNLHLMTGRPDFMRWAEKVIDLENNGYIRVLRLNWSDDASQELLRLEEALRFIHDAVLRNENVLIHCAQGKSRSGTVMIAYLMAALKMDLTTAMTMAKKQRPIIEPNAGFMSQLRTWEASSMLVSLRKEFDDDFSPIAIPSAATTATTATTTPEITTTTENIFSSVSASSTMLSFVALSPVESLAPQGTVEFHESLPSTTRAARSSSSNSKNKSIDQTNRIIHGSMVCLLLLPSYMIPTDILRYFTQPYLDKLLRMSVFRHRQNIDSCGDDYLALLEMESEEAARELIQDFGGQPLSSLEQITCVLYSVKAVHWSTTNTPSDSGIICSSGKVVMETSNSSGKGTGARRPLGLALDALNTSMRTVGSVTPSSSSNALINNGIVPLSSAKRRTYSMSQSQQILAHSVSPLIINENKRSFTFDDTATGSSSSEYVNHHHHHHQRDQDNPSSSSAPHSLHASARASPMPFMVEDLLESVESLDQRCQGDRYDGKEAISSLALQELNMLCPVCLEHIDAIRPCSFTTACRHTYHIDCIRLLEGPQCPVCRFQHDSTSESLSVCFECGWNGLTEGTAANAYHNHRNHMRGGIVDSSASFSGNYSNSSSSANAAADSSKSNQFTDETAHSSYKNSTIERHDHSTGFSSTSSSIGSSSIGPTHSSQDLWVCLVCGFVGCGRTHQSHIRAHYQQHLHAYAMNTGDRRVWDFAGDGWVHRLILQKADDDDDDDDPLDRDTMHGSGSGSAKASSNASDQLHGSDAHRMESFEFGMGRRVPLSLHHAGRGLRSVMTTSSDMNDTDAYSNGGNVNMKLVEVSDPRHQLPSRTQIPPLSSEQEEHIINRKLESAAQHYNQLVTWQLQHNREQHEIRLHRLRAFIQQETSIVHGPNNGRSLSKGTTASITEQHANGGIVTTNWTTALLQLAASEKAKLIKQCEAARTRLVAAQDEAGVLRDLNNSLLKNKTEWQRRVDAAQSKMNESQQLHRNFVTRLEEKVASLMQKLDTTSSSQTPPSSSLPSLKK